MIIIVGLGNYGTEYLLTRHNAGFIIVNSLVHHYGFSWNIKAKLSSAISNGNVDDNKVMFLKPQTYMNSSGRAVSAACIYYKVHTKNVVVIHDDLDLELGKIKCKIGGSSGGHNGIKSIDQHIGSDYARIRVGIRTNHYQDASEYVLGNFTNEQYEYILSATQIIIKHFDLVLRNNFMDFRQKISL